jgi:hypothetical protein
MAIVHFDGRVTHEGLVTGFTTHWQDSMQITTTYALVWNSETKRNDTVYLRDDYSPTWAAKAEIDACPEVLAEIQAIEEQADKQREYARQHRVDKGRMITVVRGRKLPKGLTGICIWIGSSQYGERVGLKDSSGNVHWTARTNVETVSLGHPSDCPYCHAD